VKNPLSPAVVVAVLVVMVALIAVMGWRYFKPGGSGSNSNPYEHMPAGVTRPGGMGSGGYTSGGPRSSAGQPGGNTQGSGPAPQSSTGR